MSFDLKQAVLDANRANYKYAPNPYETEPPFEPDEREPAMFDLKKVVLDATYDHLTQQDVRFERRHDDRRKVSDHPALAEILIEKLETQTKLQDEYIEMLHARIKQLEAKP